MILEDHLEYPRYQREVHGENKYKPFELKHVFDITTGEYTNNEFNCCHYSSADITGLTFTSDNTNIFVDGDELIADHIGKATITGYKDSIEKVSFKILVYKDKKPTKKLKDTILLQLNTVISIKTILRHINCIHYQDCIFEREIFKIYTNQDLRELHYDITSIQKRITDYHNIKEAYLNGDIIYHPELDDCYNIQIIKYDENGKIHHKVEVEVVEDFPEKIISRIKNSEQELKELQRIRRKIEWVNSK